MEKSVASPLSFSTSASAMMPIVFWASLAPWLKETHALDPIWPRRKPRFPGPGDTHLNNQ